MANYKEMYYSLFRAQEKADQKFRQAIELIEEAQRQTEELFMSALEPVELAKVIQKEKDGAADDGTTACENGLSVDEA